MATGREGHNVAETSPSLEALRKIAGDRVKVGEPLKPYTTFKIGGPADYLIAVHDRHELVEVCKLAGASGQRIHLLGNGSNLLVSDQGVRGFVVLLKGEFTRWRAEGDLVICGGGYNLPRLTQEVCRQGRGGLDFACGIPGTLGAGLLINAGAHGGELVDVVAEAVIVWADRAEIEHISAKDLGLAYRTSGLQGTSAIVVEVTMRLRPADPTVLMERIKHHLERRRNTQPLNLPNAGSIFKNPPGDFAGRLIEGAGCKGWREGDAQVSEKHANFIVNLGNSTARDVLVLMDRVRAAVQAHCGIRLQPEVQIWGQNPYFT